MNANPFQPPAAAVADIERPVEIDEVTRRDIRNAWIIATISGCVTLVAAAFATLAAPVIGLEALSFVDAAVVFALAYGIHRRSRTCAVLLLAYFVLSKLLMLPAGISAVSLSIALVFIYFMVRGVIGTFRYHRAARA